MELEAQQDPFSSFSVTEFDFLQTARQIRIKYLLFVVPTDMKLAFMDGGTTIRVPGKMNAQMNIVASSGMAGNHDAAQIASTRVGADIPKPYTAEKLLPTFCDVLERTLTTMEDSL